MQYYEDIKLHQKYRSREYRLKEKEIISYAKRWDPQPFHIDPEFARSTKFGGVFAAGVHLLAIGAKLSSEREHKIAWGAGLGWKNVQFLGPARPGDILVMEQEAISKRISKSNPNTGIVHLLTRLLNQHGEIILAVEAFGLIERRPAK